MAGVVITIRRTKTVAPRTIEFNEIFFISNLQMLNTSWSLRVLTKYFNVPRFLTSKLHRGPLAALDRIERLDTADGEFNNPTINKRIHPRRSRKCGAACSVL